MMAIMCIVLHLISVPPKWIPKLNIVDILKRKNKNMQNRILIVYEKQGAQKELMVILAGLGDIKCSQTIQDALLNMITHWHQLIVIVGINNPEYLCKVIETIRIIKKYPY